MKITIISDTHGKHEELTSQLKGGDLLIHCGDSMTSGYSDYQLIDFCEWFNNLEGYKCKIFIAGNHCRLFENYPDIAINIVKEYHSITYLQDEEYVFNGVKIYGSPWQPWFLNWAFNLPRGGKELKNVWNKIPKDVDILVTHCPPMNILDNVYGGEPLGCELLTDKVKELKKLKIHCWGHIHDSYGYELVDKIHCFNASNLNESYECVNKPHSFSWNKQKNIIKWKQDS